MLIDRILTDEPQYEVVLCTPSGVAVDTLFVRDLEYSPNFRTPNELSFSIDFKEQGITGIRKNEYFKYLIGDYLIQLNINFSNKSSKTEFFVITNPEELINDYSSKSIQCMSLEYKFARKLVRHFEGTRKLYDFNNSFDPSDAEKGGILNLIIEENFDDAWEVTRVPTTLQDTYRTFEITNRSVAQVIDDLEEEFECIFQYDTVNKTIEIYTKDEIGTNYDVVLSDENVVNEITKQTDYSNIITRLYIEGKDNATIHRANPTGQGFIDDFSYYRKPEYMTSDLLNALDEYDAVTSELKGEFDSLLEDLDGKIAEKNDMENSFFDLTVQLRTLEDKEDIAIIEGTADGEDYNYWHDKTLIQKADMQALQNHINSIESEIDGIYSQMASLSQQISYASNFTPEQRKELNFFVHEAVERIGITDPRELYLEGEKRLKEKSSPVIEFTINCADFFSVEEFKFLRDRLRIGDFVNLISEENDLDEYLRVMHLTHNPESGTLALTLCNRDKLNDDYEFFQQLQDRLNQASNILEDERGLYREYIKDRESIIKEGDYIDTSDNEIGIGESVLTRRGQFMRDLPGAGGQIRIYGDRIIFTQDNWENIHVGITSAGIFTNNDFVIDMVAETYNGAGRILLNPSDGIKIQQASGSEWEDTFYVGTDGRIKATGLDIFGDSTFAGNIEINQVLGLDDELDPLYEGLDQANSSIASVANGTYDGTFISGRVINSPNIVTPNAGMSSQGSANSSVRIWAGSSYNGRGSAPFRVTQNGAVYASNLTIAGGSISWSNINSDPEIAVAKSDASSAQSTADSAITQVGILQGDLEDIEGTMITETSIQTVDVLAQNLRVSSANVEGTITAEEVRLPNAGMTSSSLHSNVRFWAGHGYFSRSSAPFQVRQDGTTIMGASSSFTMTNGTGIWIPNQIGSSGADGIYNRGGRGTSTSPIGARWKYNNSIYLRQTSIDFRIFFNSNTVFQVFSNGDTVVNGIGTFEVLEATNVSERSSNYENAVISTSSGRIFYEGSSRKLKTNIEEYTGFNILKANPVWFQDKKVLSETGSCPFTIGFIAEEMHDIGMKEVIGYRDGKPATVHYNKIGVALLPVVKNQEERIKQLEKQLKELKEEENGN